MTAADVAELRMVATSRPPTDREVLEQVLRLTETLVAQNTELRAIVTALRGQLDTCVDAAHAATSAAHAAVNRVMELKEVVDGLRDELRTTHASALSARVDAEIAARAATSAAEVLAEQEREHRRERDTDPDLRRFESSAPT